MINMINKIIYLDDNSRYMILDQGFYNNKNYYFVCEVDDNDKLTDTLTIFEEEIENNVINIKTIENKELLSKVLKYFKDRIESSK